VNEFGFNLIFVGLAVGHWNNFQVNSGFAMKLQPENTDAAALQKDINQFVGRDNTAIRCEDAVLTAPLYFQREAFETATAPLLEDRCDIANLVSDERHRKAGEVGDQDLADLTGLNGTAVANHLNMKQTRKRMDAASISALGPNCAEFRAAIVLMNRRLKRPLRCLVWVRRERRGGIG
jgi:hypothetical protein